MKRSTRAVPSQLHPVHGLAMNIPSNALTFLKCFTFRFTEAMRASVQHTFRMAAVHLYGQFPSPPFVAVTPPSAVDNSPSSTSPESSPKRRESVTSNGNLVGSSSGSATGTATGSYRRIDSRVFGAVPTGRGAQNGAGGGGGGTNGGNNSTKLPRQLARLLKPVQAAGDAAFENIHVVTKASDESPQGLSCWVIMRNVSGDLPMYSQAQLLALMYCRLT